MRYTPHTNAERAKMLKAIGVERIEDLFTDIPEQVRFPTLDLPEGVSELEVQRLFHQVASENASVADYPCFLGAGAYYHFTPAVLPHLLFRSEFYTSYTPYQAEVSQGTLQTIFEFQTLVCQLTGMEVANASMYDGSTALAEAALMAVRLTRSKRSRIIISDAVHPEYHTVLDTYTRGMDLDIVSVPFDREAGITDLDALDELLNDDTAVVLVQYPNFFGQIEPLQALGDAVHAAGGYFAVCADPIALSMLTPPGVFDADIVTGEGQSLGIPLFYGGPYVGLFATREKFIRQMPGRVAGQTVDRDGRRGFVLTLQAREQHIRREKATSNICTNEALIATAMTIYLAVVGKNGVRTVGRHCYHKSHYLATQLTALDGYERTFNGPFMREFAVRTPAPVADLNRYLWEEHGIIGGYDLSRAYADLDRHWLLTATEMNTREEIDRLVKAVRQFHGYTLQ